MMNQKQEKIVSFLIWNFIQCADGNPDLINNFCFTKVVHV